MNWPKARVERLVKRLFQPRVILITYALFAIAASVQKYYEPPRSMWGGEYTHYNNYQTFRHSYPNLIAGQDLYEAHPGQHGDLFKYSPTFALLMAPFWWLPVLPGLTLWNLLNALVLYAALATLPVKGFRPRALMLWFVLIELITSLQNAQSNGLMVGLMVLGYNASEKNRTGLASLLLATASYVKLFALPAFFLFLLHDGRRARAVIWSTVWMGLLAVLPLLVVSWPELVKHYESWWVLLQGDISGPHLSVRGIWNQWAGVHMSNAAAIGLGLAFFISSWGRQLGLRSLRGRMLFLASLLVWVVIFNHKAESPTYVVAMTGVCIWYFTQSSTPLRTMMFSAAMVLTSLSPTFLFPGFLRTAVVYPLKLKAVPCILIYGRQWWELVTGRFSPAVKVEGE